MKFSKVVLAVCIFVAMYSTYIYFSRAGVVYGVYQNVSYDENWERKCRSTIVLVDEAPLTQTGLIKLWQRERSAIIDKWKPFFNNCDYILFVENKLEYPHDSEEIDYWEGDYQICLKGVLGKCISRDSRLFYIGTNELVYGKNVAGIIGNKNLYIYFIE